MKYYRCMVADASGRKREVITRAVNQMALEEGYAGKGEYLLSYKEAEHENVRGRTKFSRKLLTEFTGIMTALLAGGNTVQGSLELCRDMGGDLRRFCGSVLEGIQRGERFGEALMRCGRSISPLYEAMVEIGEKTGKTAEVFRRLSGYLKTAGKVRTKLGGALFYPLFVLGCALVGSVIILVSIMPRMAEFFAVFQVGVGREAEVDMGGMYRTLYGMVIVLGGTAGAVTVSAVVRRFSARAALALDRIVLRMPVAGPFITALESLDFFCALELCSQAGMNAALALEEAGKVLRNRYYRKSVTEVRDAIAEGEQLSRAFLERKVFPALIGHWLAVGERTGDGRAVFERIRIFFEETVDTAVERFTGSLEPILITVTGCILLALVMQFVVPLFELYGAVL
jgi:type II secretory pathway component PulF